jgi:hypothetical protein
MLDKEDRNRIVNMLGMVEKLFDNIAIIAVDKTDDSIVYGINYVKEQEEEQEDKLKGVETG